MYHDQWCLQLRVGVMKLPSISFIMYELFLIILILINLYELLIHIHILHTNY